MSPAAEALTRKLLIALDDEARLTEAHKHETIVPHDVMLARKAVRVLTADLSAALAEPLRIAPWTPWNGITRTGPVSSVGTTEGREL